jgi:hypothetical protein
VALLWTTPADVRGRWVGDDPFPFPEGDDVTLSTLLEDAEDTVLREFPTLPDRVDADPATVANSIPKRRVAKVVARVVIRHLRNPAGQRSRMDVSGPFTQNVMFGGEEPGALYLTDEDRSELGGTEPGQAFTIDTTPAIIPTSPETWLELGRTWY